MKKLLFTIAGMLLFFSAIPSQAQTVDSNFVDGKIVFKFKDSYPITFTVQKDRTIFISEFPFLKQLSTKYGIKKIEQPIVIFNDSSLMRIISVEFDSVYRVNEFIKELYGTSFSDFTNPFDWVNKKVLYHSNWKPNDPYYGVTPQLKNLSWNLDMINAEQAWDIRKGKANVRVAVVDNAVWGEHEDLKIPSNLQYNAIQQAVGNSAPPAISQVCKSTSNCLAFDWSHGTHCAGVVGALTNNSLGIAAIGGGVTVVGVRASTDNSPKSMSGTVEGIRWAVEEGKAKVISLSLGGADYSADFDSIVQVCYKNGVIVVAAAGNDATSTEHYPAAYRHVIAVGSVDGNRKLSSFSEYGVWVDVAAPGGGNDTVSGYTSTGIFSSTFSQNASSPFDGQYYDFMQGTSMACPLVAGLCGLMLSMNPDLHPDTVRNILQRTSQPITATSGKSIDPNGGIVDAYAAMLEVEKTVPQARFSANKTTVQEGSSVTFTDQSTGGPASINKWEWAFEGGNPGTSSLQNPIIAYNTSGIYAVRLIVTNSNNQTDTLTQEYYMNVEVPGTPECASLSNIRVGDTLTNYLASVCDPVNTWGYLFGHNKSQDKLFAEYFANTRNIGIHTLEFNVAKMILDTLTTNSSTVIVRIQKEESNAPGTTIYEKTYSYGKFMTGIALDSSVYINSNYFISYEISYNNPKDTFAISTSTNIGNPARTTDSATAWIYKNNTWGKISSICSNYPVSLGITTQYCEKSISNPFLEAQTGPIVLDTLNFSSSTFVLQSNTNWNVSSDIPSWLSVTPLSGTGNAVTTISANANLLPSERNDTVVFSGNGKSDTVFVKQKAATAKLSTVEKNLHFTERASTLTFSVLSNVSWTISTPKSWITTLNPTQGTGNGKDTIKVNVTVAINEVLTSRRDTLVITGAGLRQEVIIEQAAATAIFDVSPTSLAFNKDGESKSITIQSNVPWEIKGLGPWVSVSQMSGNGDATVTLTATKNTTGKTRNMPITVNTDEEVPQVKNISLTQVAGEGIDIAELAKSIKVYPNPAKETLHVDDKANVIKQISFISLLGNVLWTSNEISEITNIDIANFPKGIYMLKITTKDKREYTQKIVKQ